MAIIDITYFTGNRYIDLTNPDVQTNLENTFDWVEKKYLTKLLGRETYLLFEAGKTATPYLEFIEGGINFNWNGSDRAYDGLKNMLANFTYCEYIKKNQTYNTPIGNVKFESKEQISQIDHYLFDDIYNEGVELYWEAVRYMLIETTGFEEAYPSKTVDYINTTGRLVL